MTGNSKVTGKPSHADAAREKPAFPAIIGVEKSFERAFELRDLALAASGLLVREVGGPSVKP